MKAVLQRRTSGVNTVLLIWLIFSWSAPARCTAQEYTLSVWTTTLRTTIRPAPTSLCLAVTVREVTRYILHFFTPHFSPSLPFMHAGRSVLKCRHFCRHSRWVATIDFFFFWPDVLPECNEARKTSTDIQKYHRVKSVVLHCSDGWISNPQITYSLSLRVYCIVSAGSLTMNSFLLCTPTLLGYLITSLILCIRYPQSQKTPCMTEKSMCKWLPAETKTL